MGNTLEIKCGGAKFLEQQAQGARTHGIRMPGDGQGCKSPGGGGGGAIIVWNKLCGKALKFSQMGTSPRGGLTPSMANPLGAVTGLI
jgi:hypothetical protein